MYSHMFFRPSAIPFVHLLFGLLIRGSDLHLTYVELLSQLNFDAGLREVWYFPFGQSWECAR